MLLTIAIILFALWLLGVVFRFTLGGLIHILLVVAIITVIVRLIRGKKFSVNKGRVVKNFVSD